MRVAVTRSWSSTWASDAISRRRAGSVIAAALEANLDRYPKKEQLWNLLTHWLDAAKREGLAARYPDYVKALERAIVIVSKAASPQHAIEALRAR
jgi:hypothetical protein